VVEYSDAKVSSMTMCSTGRFGIGSLRGCLIWSNIVLCPVQTLLGEIYHGSVQADVTERRHVKGLGELGWHLGLWGPRHVGTVSADEAALARQSELKCG
jgi:hypothetical protein